MNRNKGKKIIRKSLPIFISHLHIGAQTITIGFNDKLSDEKMRNAECLLFPEYKKNMITIDLKSIQTKKELLDALWHELIHGVLMEFDVYKNQVKRAVSFGEEDNRTRMLDKTFFDCHERTVKHLLSIIKQPRV